MIDNIYRVFMFVLPFAICLAAYVWVGKKALRVPQKAARIGALAVVCGGLVYTVYRLIKAIGTAFANDNFEYIIVIVTVAVLALASIIMAIGEPEAPVKESAPTPSGNTQEATNRQ